jgi:hypothetical protein
MTLITIKGGSMMKRLVLILFISALCMTFFALDVQSLKLGGKELVINGSGERTILGTMYIATLWVTDQLKGKSGKEIIEANEPMSVVLVLDSILITRERFVSTTKEGFAKSASSGYASAKTQMFLDQFNNVEFKKGDVVSLNYTKAGLVTQIKPIKTGVVETLGSIPGLDLKKALFAIWIGPNPVQESLKAALLSGKGK